MDWIKKNYDKFVLALLSVALLGASAMIVMNTSGFEERFSAALANPPPNNQIPAVDTAVIDQARRQLEQPVIWKPRSEPDAPNDGLLFTATRYIGPPLTKVKHASSWRHSRTQEAIPNQWVIEHNLNPLNPDDARQDADGDGFWNEDEWLHKTDPNKKESHPPYHTLLFLKQWVKVPFRLKFQAYDGDPKKPESMSFQINTIDLKTPTQFPKIGESIETAPDFKLIKFEYKETENPSTGEKDDVSTLTLLNTKTGDNVVLILNKVVDSPNQFAVFAYYLVAAGISDGKKPLEFTVPKLGEFVLRPETTKRYKLLDVNATQAVIQAPDGEKITIPTYPGAPAPGATAR